MTKAEQIHERIDALVAGGLTKAEAFRRLADELGQPAKSLQGAYYTAARKAGSKGSSRKRETSPTDAVASAALVLESAITAIDDEVATAKDRADEAKAEFEALKASANERKATIKAKLEALSA